MIYSRVLSAAVCVVYFAWRAIEGDVMGRLLVGLFGYMMLLVLIWFPDPFANAISGNVFVSPTINRTTPARFVVIGAWCLLVAGISTNIYILANM